MDANLDLHSIRIVRAIAEHGTISAAARALGYSQPAISQHLRRSEARLGTPLVIRSGRGVRLSEAGQVVARHAVAITSALDAATEYALHQALGRFLSGRTTLIIAHRLSAVKQADRVLVFDGGRIAEDGDHQQLIADGGLYAKLYGHLQH